MTDRFEKSKIRRFLGSGHIGSGLEDDLPNSIPLCPHNDYCSMKRFKNVAYCSVDAAKQCQTAKYYNKYGQETLGI